MVFGDIWRMKPSQYRYLFNDVSDVIVGSLDLDDLDRDSLPSTLVHTASLS